MSRIGRLPVTVPSGVDVTIDGRKVHVKGPKGELRLEVAAPIEVKQQDGVITVTRPSDEGEIRALHGLSRSLIANMVTGVTDGYRKTMEIVGVGYRVQARGKDLEFALAVLQLMLQCLQLRREHLFDLSLRNLYSFSGQLLGLLAHAHSFLLAYCCQ